MQRCLWLRRSAIRLPVAGACSLALAFTAAAATQSGPALSDAPRAAEGAAAANLRDQGRRLFETRCNECHAYQDAAQFRNSRAAWAQVVDRMTSSGLDATADEKTLIIDYLALTYPADG